MYQAHNWIIVYRKDLLLPSALQSIMVTQHLKLFPKAIGTVFKNPSLASQRTRGLSLLCSFYRLLREETCFICRQVACKHVTEQASIVMLSFVHTLLVGNAMQCLLTDTFFSGVDKYVTASVSIDADAACVLFSKGTIWP